MYFPVLQGHKRKFNIITEGELHCIDIKVVKLRETSLPVLLTAWITVSDRLEPKGGHIFGVVGCDVGR